MKAYTDHPFGILGDHPCTTARIRQIEVVSYDDDKYCKIIVEGFHEEIKLGYIYSNERLGKLTINQILSIPIDRTI